MARKASLPCASVLITLSLILTRLLSRLPDIVQLTSELVDNAQRLREALLAGDLPTVGACLGTYWSQKKAMAGGRLPSHCFV